MHEQELKGSLKGVEHTSHSYYGHKLKNIGYYYPSVCVCHDQLYKMCASNFIQQEHAPIYSQPILNLASLPSKLTQWYSWPYIHILNSMVPTIGIRAHDAFALDSVLLSEFQWACIWTLRTPQKSYAKDIKCNGHHQLWYQIVRNMSSGQVHTVANMTGTTRMRRKVLAWKRTGMDCHFPCLMKLDLHTELTTVKDWKCNFKHYELNLRGGYQK